MATETVQIPRDRYYTVPYAVRVVANPVRPAGRVMRISLTHVLVGGQPVVFNGETNRLTIAGQEFDLIQWMELRRRIDLVYQRAGLLEKVAPAKSDVEGRSSSFLTRNWRPITDQQSGTWRKPPWWLRWLYSAVITKEFHGEHS